MVTFGCVYDKPWFGDYENDYGFYVQSNAENVSIKFDLESIVKALQEDGKEVTIQERGDNHIKFRWKSDKRNIQKELVTDFIFVNEDTKVSLSFWSDSNDQYINLKAGDEFKVIKDSRDIHVISRKKDGLQIALHGTMVNNVNISINNNSNWMKRLATKNPELQLKELYIPGTHDSATYNINESSDYADPELREGNKSELMKISKSISVDLAKAQDTRIFNQLVDGVRLLDLRACKQDNSDDIWISHSLYSVPLDEVLEDISKFLEKNTGELVILDFRYVWGLSSNRKEYSQKLWNKVNSKLKENIIAVDVYQLGMWKIGNLLQRSKGGVILLWDINDGKTEGSGMDREFVEREQCGLNTRSWASIIGEGDEYDDAEKLIARIRDTIEQRDNNMLCLVKCEIDKEFNFSRVIGGLRSLEYIASKSNPKMLEEIKNNWGKSELKKGCIYTFDYYNNCDLANTIIQLNWVD